MKAHRTDLVSLAFGLLFLGFAVWWLVAQILGLVLPPVGWFLAGALLLVGVLGLAGAVRSARRGGGPPSGDTPAPGTDEWPPQAVTDHDDRADAWPTEAVTDRDERADEWPRDRDERPDERPAPPSADRTDDRDRFPG